MTLTLRQTYALHADVGNVTFPTLDDAAAFANLPVPDTTDVTAMIDFQLRVVANLRFRMADAMIEAERDHARAAVHAVLENAG